MGRTKTRDKHDFEIVLRHKNQGHIRFRQRPPVGGCRRARPERTGVCPYFFECKLPRRYHTTANAIAYVYLWRFEPPSARSR